MKRYHSLFVLIIFLLFSYKQAKAHCTNPESVYKSIEASDVSDTVKAGMYVDFAINHRVGFPVLSINCLQKAMAIYEKEGRETDAVSARGFMAQIYKQMGLYSIAAEHFMYAFKVFLKLNDNISLAWLLIDIGNLYFDIQNYGKALFFYQKSIERFRADNHNFGVSVNILNFGLIKEKQGKYNAALFYFNECLKIREGLDDEYLVAHINSYIGRIYIKLGEYDKAYKSIYKSIEIVNGLSEKIDLVEQQLYTDYNLLAQMFEDMQREETAIQYADTALKTAIQNNDTINIIKANIYMGLLYYNRGDNKKSVEFLEKSLIIAKTYNKSDDVLENIYMHLIIAYLNIGNSRQLEKYYHEFENNREKKEHINNDVRNDNLDMVINSFLLEEALEKSENRAQTIKYFTYILLIIFISILVILAVFYYYKNRLYKNQRHLINSAFDGIVIHTEGIIYDVNESFLKFTGYSYKELIKSSIYKLIDTSLHGEVRKNVSLNRGAFYHSKLKLKDNTLVDVEAYATAYEYEGKQMRLITVKDISERIKAQQQIELFKTIVEQNFSSILITDTNGRIEYVNPSFSRITGYSAEESLGKKPSILKSGYHDEEFYKNLWDRINKGKAWIGFFNNISKEGINFWEQAIITPIKDKDGKIIKFVAIKRDITKSKQLEDEIRTYNEQLKIIFEGLLALVIVVDYETEQIIFTNQKVDIVFGDVEGTHINDLIIDKEGERTILLEKPIIAEDNSKEEYIKKEIYLTDKKIWYDVEFRIIKWVDGRKAVLILADDITDKKNTIIALNEINASKDKFFSIISHDLRNPFQGLLGFSDILKNNVDFNDADTIKMIIENIYSVSKTSYDLLEKLLEWAKIQKGIIKINKEKAQLYLLVDEQVKSLITLADKKSITININIDKELTVNVDIYVLTTVLRNIINNAIKFTPNEGLINIETQLKDGEALLSVRDNGIGIPQEMLQSMFRIDTKYSILGTAGEKGAGLGLIICKELLELQGSKIFVESTYNKGSTFFITLELWGE